MRDEFISVNVLLQPFGAPIVTSLLDSEQEHRYPRDHCKYTGITYLYTS
jgi:hypothetical protein